MRLEAYQHGMYPRSERLVATTRDFDRGRADGQRLDEDYRRDLEEFVSVQKHARLDYLSDGMLRWQDLFRPFVNHSPGLDSGPLTRWFDTNSFFRAPVVTGPLSIDPSAVDIPDIDADRRRVVSLPSPYAFSRAAQFDGDRDVLMLDLARDLLAPVAAQAVRKNAGVLHLEDPWLGFYGVDASGWSALGKSIEELRDGLDVTVVFHTYFGDVSRFIHQLQGLPVDAVGIDVFATDTDLLKTRTEVGILLGCFDGRNSLVERPEEVAVTVSRLLDRLMPSACFLSSGGDLQLVSEELARRKVTALGEVMRVLREEVS